jgi:hypothetical protein
VSITLDAPAPPGDMPAQPQPVPDSPLFEKLRGLQVTAARLARDRDAALIMAATIDRQRRLAQRDLAALLRSCHARQTALADPTVRERLLEAQMATYRAYTGRLERLLDDALAENDALKAATADTITMPAVGRRRRRH